MRLSLETARQRWLLMIATWAIACGLLFFHAAMTEEYMGMVGKLGLRAASTPTTPLQAAFPSFAADAQTWVRHALSLLEGDDVRLRYTYIDNPPNGREVHWNSAWAWILALSGKMDHWLTRSPLPYSVERMTIWVPPFTFLILLVIISAWIAHRAGALLGIFAALALVGHPRVFEGFFPGYFDHHGLLTVSVFGALLGVTLMGGGWWNSRGSSLGLSLLPESAESVRRAAIFSAVSGALGLWVSAASVIAPIVIIGGSALLAILMRGRDALRNGMQFDAFAWRLWGRAGAAASVLFYLLEYFPSQLGLRLEANHPLYALAWWGGGEFIADIGERWLSPRRPGWRNWRRPALALGAILIAPMVIVLGGSKVFVVADPFLAELHHRYIQEFLPLATTIRGSGWKTFFNVVGFENVPLLVALVTIAVLRRRAPILLWFSALAAMVFIGMAWVQSRWLLNASGSQICVAMVLLAHFTSGVRSIIRWPAALAAVGLLFLPSAVTRTLDGRADLTARRVAPKDAYLMLCRDIAVQLRSSQPTGEIVLLSSPNASTAVGYYGRFKTLGTLYWENIEGLKAAAMLHSVKNEAEAANLLRRHGVTHIAMISEENFIEQYFKLLHPSASEADIRKSFGFQLLADKRIPPWLQMIPYKAPEDLSSLNIQVMLFKVAFDQTPADALYHVALAKIAQGMMSDAERDIDTLIQQSPESFQPWMRKAEMLFARGEWTESSIATIKSIQRSPRVQRATLFASAASKFYRQRRPEEAIRIYRAGLKDGFDPNLAAYLAFVLATTSNDALRDGTEAQSLAERALQLDPDSPTILNSLAAALAENGSFEKAIEVARRAANAAKLQRDTAAEKVSEQRIQFYRARKPIRD